MKRKLGMDRNRKTNLREILEVILDIQAFISSSVWETSVQRDHVAKSHKISLAVLRIQIKLNSNAFSLCNWAQTSHLQTQQPYFKDNTNSKKKDHLRFIPYNTSFVENNLLPSRRFCHGSIATRCNARTLRNHRQTTAPSEAHLFSWQIAQRLRRWDTSLRKRNMIPVMSAKLQGTQKALHRNGMQRLFRDMNRNFRKIEKSQYAYLAFTFMNHVFMSFSPCNLSSPCRTTPAPCSPGALGSTYCGLYPHLVLRLRMVPSKSMMSTKDRERRYNILANTLSESTHILVERTHLSSLIL